MNNIDLFELLQGFFFSQLFCLDFGLFIVVFFDQSGYFFLS